MEYRYFQCFHYHFTHILTCSRMQTIQLTIEWPGKRDAYTHTNTFTAFHMYTFSIGTKIGRNLDCNDKQECRQHDVIQIKLLLCVVFLFGERCYKVSLTVHDGSGCCCCFLFYFLKQQVVETAAALGENGFRAPATALSTVDTKHHQQQ